MRLSTVFELLLIFLFLAFAASRTIHPKKAVKEVVKDTHNRYCQCTNLMCNCCRDFSLPVVSIKGPGCATVAYINEDAMRLTMTFGDKVLRNITLAGKRPNPVCMPLPGGVSKFCGRVYGITREGDHFKACLALELRSLEDLEAALRVSCFKFGPEGVKLEPGKPVPAVPTDEDEDGDDDYGFSDDDDDDFGLSDDDDDDDDDDEDNDDDDDDDDDETENDVDSGDVDYTGFSALSDEFLGGFFGSSNNKKKNKFPAKPLTMPSIAQSQFISKDKPMKTAVSKHSTSTNKPQSKKTTATLITKAPKRETTTAILEATQTKTIQEEITSTENYAETSIKNPSNHSKPDKQTPEISTQLIGYTTVTANNPEKYSYEDEEYESTESNSEESTETFESIDSENKDNIITSKILDDEEESKERTFTSNRGHNLTPAETEELFPGLTALIRPPSHTSFSFPPVRSARTHRRMRLPPIQN